MNSMNLRSALALSLCPSLCLRAHSNFALAFGVRGFPPLSNARRLTIPTQVSGARSVRFMSQYMLKEKETFL